MKLQLYTEAITWIALHQDIDDFVELVNTATVSLVSHVFGVDLQQCAADVMRVRLMLRGGNTDGTN